MNCIHWFFVFGAGVNDYHLQKKSNYLQIIFFFNICLDILNLFFIFVLARYSLTTKM